MTSALGNLSAMDERPAPAPRKLLDQFGEWVNDVELPGRTMANLKTGFLPEILAELEPTEAITVMLESWTGWEKGRVGPEEVLGVLKEHGLSDVLSALVSA